jgi:hypothetical protein
LGVTSDGPRRAKLPDNCRPEEIAHGRERHYRKSNT